jgi:hypothetical protein
MGALKIPLEGRIRVMSMVSQSANRVNAADVAAARQIRIDTARREAASYTIYKASRDELYVLNPETGRVSTVTRQPNGDLTCDCPDFVNRCAGLGIPCKHILGAGRNRKRYAIHPTREQLAALDADRQAAEKQARAERAPTFDRIFG